MTAPIVVVGSGAGGVHFALSLLKKGHRVLMLDVGRKRPAPVSPTEDLNSLKARLSDPVSYFLGENFEAVILPGHNDEYYGFPPNKNYVFQGLDGFEYRAEGFAPIFSFASGGLGEAWTGGCYPFTNADLKDFPFGYDVLAPYYAKVASRIGICGAEDDLTRFLPLHDGLLEPLELDEHSNSLLDAYGRNKAKLNGAHGCYMGRARIAALSRDVPGRKACARLGRCLWGCPSESLYTPSVTLRECMSHEAFQYLDGLQVTHFVCDSGNRIRKVAARGAGNGSVHGFDVGTLVLAAGTLGSSKILLDSILHQGGTLPALGGLMDNRQVLMPFVNLRLIGRPFEPKSYQYHQVALGLDGGRPEDYVHGLITTLKTALVHPIVQSIPAALGTALSFFRNLHAALGLVNVNFSDARREENRLFLERDSKTRRTRLVIEYRAAPGETPRIRAATKRLRRALRALGCVAPAAMMHVRPMGASVHYAGTVPMSVQAAPLTTDGTCRSRDFENLYFVDGTTFPSLPAKNLTFTLMANAVRVAETAF